MKVANKFEAEFSPTNIRQIKPLLHDLFAPKAWIYWADFLISWCVAGASLTVAALAWGGAGGTGVALVVAALACYRCAIFSHELTHRPGTSLRGFRIVWNVLFGIPACLPSFTYYMHRDHHHPDHYGTRQDGEYLTLAGRKWAIVGYLDKSFIIPALAVFRFFVLTPLAWLVPAVRQWVQQRASSMIIDPDYSRPAPTPAEWRIWQLQEIACFVWWLALSAAFWQGLIPWAWLGGAYMVAVLAVFLNAIRTLGAHGYANPRVSVSMEAQLLDSLTYPYHPWLASLWAPVGLRYHALHHLLPSLPYHALPAAHHRLMQTLPANSTYRQTIRLGLWCALNQLWHGEVAHLTTGGSELSTSPTTDRAPLQFPAQQPLG